MMVQKHAMAQTSVLDEEVKFTDLYQRYATRIFQYVLCRIHNEELAKDITQDTFEKAWRVRSSIIADSVSGWLYTIAYHTMIDYIRHNQRAISLEVHANQHADEMISGIDIQEQYLCASAVTTTLRHLTQRYREVLYFNIVAGYTPQEYMHHFGYTLSTARTTLARARKAFRRNYNRNNPQEEDIRSRRASSEEEKKDVVGQRR